jgi:hypothetical protein
MPTDKDVKRGEVKTAVGGVALGGLAYVVDHVPIHDPAFMHQVDQYTNPVFWIAGGVIAAGIGHNRWYFSNTQRFLRTLGEDKWLDRFDLRDYAGAKAIRSNADHLRPGLPTRVAASR